MPCPAKPLTFGLRAQSGIRCHHKIVVMADITIPAALLPADGRFGCGPSKVRDEQIAFLASLQPSTIVTDQGIAEIFGYSEAGQASNLITHAARPEARPQLLAEAQRFGLL